VIKAQRRLVSSIGLLLAALTAACGGDVVLPNEGEAASLEIVDGNEQIGPAGTTLPLQVVVRVLDTRERPVANHDVTFTIGSGGGTVEPTTVKSNASGQAGASWTLGPNSGSHLLRVQAPRGGSGTLELTVRATAVAGSGSVLVGAGGEDQTGPVSSALADSLVVKATDALGNPVADVEVTWSVSGGGGSISPTTVVTGADGLAAAERVLGPVAGAQSAQATVDQFTGSPVTFSHTAVPANPTVLVKISGDGQSAPGGFEVPFDLVVRLEDDNENGIGGRAITWVVPSGSGSVNPGNTTTDANGLATTRWTLPSAVGSYGVSAVFSGLPAVSFTGTATADDPTTIELVSGNDQSASVGGALPNPLVVRVTDANDIPVANVGVVWTAEVGGSVSAENTATDASGLAQVTRTLGLLPGPYTTIAAVDGLSGSPVTFTSTATVGPAAKLAIITQPGTTATSGQPLVSQPEIEVQDALGNPILQAGRTVSASITSSPEDPIGPGSATLAGANDQTNSSGRTTYTNLRITGPSGSYVLTFSSGALIPVSSATITLGVGNPTRLVMQQQPSATAASGAVISPAPIVRVEDAAGNPVAGNRNILVDIESGPGVLSGTTTVNTGGGATATFNNLRITGTGPHTLLFSSAGLTSVESGTIDITAASTTTSLSAEPGSSVEGEEVTFTASVTSGGGTPTGQVSFRDAGSEIGQGTLAAGVATFATTALTAGMHPITAHYLGDDAFGTSASSTLEYSVGANVAPSAQADVFDVNEDETLNVTPRGVLANDDDPDGDDNSLTAVLISGPAQDLSFIFDPDGSFTYTPNPDYNGPDSFTYQANDGQANSNTATVTITVNPVNDDPGFTAGGDVSTSSLTSSILGQSHAGWASGISPGPPNEGSQTVGFEISTDADDAFQTTPQIDPDGTLTYRPFLRFDAIVVNATIVAVDSEGTPSDPQGFTITINP
jgi:hypothetical protein